MEKEQKKEYTAPKMEVVEYKHESALLAYSGGDESSITTRWLH